MKILMSTFEDQAGPRVNVIVDGGKKVSQIQTMSVSSAKLNLSVYEGAKVEDVQDINLILTIKNT